MELELVGKSRIRCLGGGGVVMDEGVFAETLSTQIYDSALWQHESFWREVAGQPSAFPRALCAERRAERVVVWMDVSSRLERHSGAAAGMFRAGSAFRVRNPRQQDSQRAVKERETNKDNPLTLVCCCAPGRK
jgi:hypothetical protein